jgi:hypothetical protein
VASRRPILDVFAVFIERRRADTVHFTARQSGFEHVARVNGALGGARADDGVKLVDKDDDLAVGARISCMMRFMRSSNSPRYLVPATTLAKSSAMTLSNNGSGTSRVTMRCAKPSTMAVLPTPGSPTRTGYSCCGGKGLDGAVNLLVAANDGV